MPSLVLKVQFSFSPNRSKHCRPAEEHHGKKSVCVRVCACVSVCVQIYVCVCVYPSVKSACCCCSFASVSQRETAPRAGPKKKKKKKKVFIYSSIMLGEKLSLWWEHFFFFFSFLIPAVCLKVAPTSPQCVWFIFSFFTFFSSCFFFFSKQTLDLFFLLTASVIVFKSGSEAANSGTAGFKSRAWFFTRAKILFILFRHGIFFFFPFREKWGESF